MLRGTKIIQKITQIGMSNQNNIKYKREIIKDLQKVKLFQQISDEESTQYVIKICGDVQP